jgi:hypothetical protein
MGRKLRLPGASRNLIRWPVAQLAGTEAGDKAVEAVEEAATEAVASEAEKELLRRLGGRGKDHLR